MQILQYNHLDYSKVTEQYKKVISQLENDDFRSAEVKKITNTPYYRAKLDYSNRLLFKIVTYNDKRYILALEIIYNHDYGSSRFLNGAKIDESQIIEPQNLSIEPISYINENIPSFNILDKIISFDDAQYAILKFNFPLIIIGSAGSGKTVLTLEKMKECYGDILYITHSPFLVEYSRNLYYANQFSNEDQNIDFLSYRELLETIKIPEGKEINSRMFSTWLIRQNRIRLFKDANKLFEEFKGVLTGSVIDKKYLTRDEYIGLGIKQSIFQPEERLLVYDLFAKYLNFLATEKIYDSNIVSFEYLHLCQPKYDFIIIDEVQDFTNIQLYFILRMLKNKAQFILSGDSNQIVHPNFFSWSKIKTMLHQLSQDQKPLEMIPADIIRILYKNYRNSSVITQTANNILMLKNLRFGSIDKESNYLVESHTAQKGTITCLNSNNITALLELNEKTKKSTKYAVIVLHDDLKQEARKYFSTPLIFSIQEAKGLEYPSVILFNFISCEDQKYYEITKGVSPEDLNQDLMYSRAKDKSDHSLEIYKFYINTLYVAITRAIDNVYIVDDRPKHVLFALLGLKDVSVGLTLTCEESSIEEWRKEARKLELQGKLEQVEEIKNNIFEQKTVPWQVINKEQLTILQDKVFNSDKTDKEVMLQLFEYAVVYNQLPLVDKLKALNFKPAHRVDQAKNIIEGKYYNSYSFNNFNSVIKDTNTYGIDFRNQFNQTPLMIAVTAGNTPLVQHLIKSGANITLVDNMGRNALQLTLLQAFFNSKYAQKRLAELYPLLVSSSISIKVGDKLIKLDNKHMEFFVFNLMQVLTANKSYCQGFRTEDFLKPLDRFPENVLLARRKKRSYLSSIFSKNEINRDDKYNRKLFLRVSHGRYILNRDLEIKTEKEEWRNVYELMDIDKEKLFFDVCKSLVLNNKFVKKITGEVKDFTEELNFNKKYLDEITSRIRYYNAAKEMDGLIGELGGVCDKLEKIEERIIPGKEDFFKDDKHVAEIVETTEEPQAPLRFLRIKNKENATETPKRKIDLLGEWDVSDYGNIVEINRNCNYWNKMRGENPELLIWNEISTISRFTRYIYTQGWRRIEIIDGTNLLGFLFFIEAKRWDLDLTVSIPDSDKEDWNSSDIINSAKNNNFIFKKRIDELEDEKHDREVYGEFVKVYERMVLRSGSKRLRILNPETLSKRPTKGVASSYMSTGWAIDDYGDAIEIRDPYVPPSKRQEGTDGPSINEQIATIAELVKIIVKENWTEVKIVSGPRMLQFLFWRECVKSGIKVFGYALNGEETKNHSKIVEAVISGQN